MKGEIKRTIDRAFYDYNLNKKRSRQTAEWAEKGITVNYGKLPVQASYGGRERSLCAVIDDEITAQTWCKVVENTLVKYYDDCRKKLIELRFFKKRPFESIPLDLNVSRATMFRYLDDIRETAVFWAKQFKLI